MSEKEESKTESIGRCVLSTKLKEIWRICLYAVIGPLLLYGLFNLFSTYKNEIGTMAKSLCPQVDKTHSESRKKPIFWIYANSPDEGYLRHVFNVLERLGFERGTNESDWDLLWAHDYPFRKLSVELKNLREHQMVNHFPGCGYITNKVDLSTTGGKYIPLSFKLPEDKSALLSYAAENPGKSFVQKSNAHRGIHIKRIDELNLDTEGSFVQEFIEKPYLVDGYKFDVGIYTVITSVDPLRVYAYKGDVLFRFCPTKYYPFDPEDVDKYVVGDDYLPIWKVPSLKDYYTRLGFSMKDSFDAYVRSKGQDPEKMWNHAFEAIKEVALKKEAPIKEITERFAGSGKHFFELVRFDFTIDQDLNVFVMEANMSPNLSSAHYPPNRLLYEQVLFNLFALVGIGQRSTEEFRRVRDWTNREVEVADKNLVVLPEFCSSCKDCFHIECQLCKPCFTKETRIILSQSYLEHQNKMDYKRIFPPSNITKDMDLKGYSLRNQLLVRWYQGKCEIDPTWCN
ncbi:probable tubulin polyglutamylase ttll-15 [Venturia canescens]|uniref:probable tubulin polyglutamylase ttll-15 n=1 Tax=Venturia canescens TaxID=32260 RepID=UPI001C9D06C6|nr:probable tubulin polyglutamylase ttll-15 [Venturia canescens]